MATAEEPEAPAERGGLGRGGLVGALLLLVIAVLTVWSQTPPAPVVADAPADQFSADRAQRQIEQIARTPRPVGTSELLRVRDYLVGQLRGLGLAPEVHTGVGIPPESLREAAKIVPVARAQNIVAVIEGTAPTGRLLLAAHYDSVPSGPGANDDAAGVAAVLEVARALTQGAAKPRNDIVLLLTDAEEIGLLGAEAYTRDRPTGPNDLVLNHESRGAAGATMMFRTTPGAGALVRLYADVAPHPAADSMTAGLFGIMPNDTDITVFGAAGMTGLDSAYAAKGAYYHSSLDAPAHVSRRSVQQMGDNTLAMARVLVDADLAAYSRSSGAADRVYFTVPPGKVVHFAAGWAWLLVAVSVALLIAALLLVVGRGLATVRQLVLATVATGVLLGASIIAGLVYWLLIVVAQRDIISLPSPWNPLSLEAGVTAVGVAVLGCWYWLMRRGVSRPRRLRFGGLSPWALWAGALVVLTVGGVAATAVSWELAPVIVPVPFAAAGGLGALLLRGPALRVASLTVGLIPAAVLLVAGGWGYFEIGLALGMFLALPAFALSAVLAAPLLSGRDGSGAAERSAWRSAALPVGAAATALALGIVGFVVNAPSAASPSPVRFSYFLDADTGRAQWVVPTGRGEFPKLDPWTKQYVGADRVDNPLPDPDLTQAFVGPATPIDRKPPQLRILGDTTAGEVRTVRFALSTPQPAEAIRLVFDDPDGRVSTLIVDGREVRAKSRPGPVGVTVFGVDGESVVEVRFRPGPPLRFRLAALNRLPSALAAVPGYSAPPDRVYLRQSWLTVVAGHQF